MKKAKKFKKKVVEGEAPKKTKPTQEWLADIKREARTANKRRDALARHYMKGLEFNGKARIALVLASIMEATNDTSPADRIEAAKVLGRLLNLKT